MGDVCQDCILLAERCFSVELFIGTSGWSYDWNSGGNLDWYLMHSGLNAVELNMSFYRFPFKNQVSGWAKKGKDLSWCVKVHRCVTHQYKFNDTARTTWQQFLDLFAPLDPLIDYYLFQAPPSMKNVDRLVEFFTDLPFQEKCVLEIRNKSLLLDDSACRRLQEYVPLVSVDSPEAKNRIFDSSPLYLRMHGRTDWYQHEYPEEELKETAELIRDTHAENVYIFFNNNHAMLKNARRMRHILAREIM